MIVVIGFWFFVGIFAYVTLPGSSFTANNIVDLRRLDIFNIFERAAQTRHTFDNSLEQKALLFGQIFGVHFENARISFECIDGGTYWWRQWR